MSSAPTGVTRARHTIPDEIARHGFRLTGPRRAVVDVLVAHAVPLSVAEIHAKLEIRRANLVSVYRAVNLLCELGLLQVADTSKGTQRFELAEQFIGHHHHLICQECGRVEDLDGCVLEEDVLDALRQHVQRSRSFRLTGHDLKLFGICRRCGSRRF